MNIIQNVFSEQFIYALGWTLLHSLWQGALIGILIAGAMVFLHRYTARLRYFIYSISLFLVAGLAVITFISAYLSFQPEDENLVSGESSAMYVAGSADNIRPVYVQAQSENKLGAILHNTAVYCRTHIPLFVTIWLLGMLAFMLRFLGGYALVRRYRYHRTHAVGGEWGRKFRKLAQRIEVRANVRLLESALVKVPMAIGYLKPVVLIPLGALNGVPALQMEAILVHELAHIRRRDYLMNLIQSLMEAIFFYHPVVWWLSGNIRIERENICDDIAITITGNTMEFAKALTNIQELNLTAPGLAAGLSGKSKNRLVNRIRRIADKPKLHAGLAEGFIAASILLVSLIGLSAAAMITYPAENQFNIPLNFDDSGSGLPEISYFYEPVVLPDTTEKKIQEAEKAELERVKEIEAAVEAELKAVQTQMEAIETEMIHEQAMEAYEKAMLEAYANQEAYQAEMQEAMEAYQQAMQEAQINMQGVQWNLPQLYHSPGNYHIYGGDSLLRIYEHTGNYVIYDDSLRDLYIDQWTDVFADYDDIEAMADLEENMMIFESQFDELKEIYEEIEFEVPDFELPELEAPTYIFEPGSYHFPLNYSISDRSGRIITDELRADDLIEYGREYMVVIGKKQMLINGEKQSRTVFKKYRRLIDSMEEPWQLGEDEEFRIHIGH